MPGAAILARPDGSVRVRLPRPPGAGRAVAGRGLGARVAMIRDGSLAADGLVDRSRRARSRNALAALVLDEALLAEMTAHCLRAYPAEGCGLLAGEGSSGRVVRCFPTRNQAASARLYVVDPGDHLARTGRRRAKAWRSSGCSTPTRTRTPIRRRPTSRRPQTRTGTTSSSRCAARLRRCGRSASPAASSSRSRSPSAESGPGAFPQVKGGRDSWTASLEYDLFGQHSVGESPRRSRCPVEVRLPTLLRPATGGKAKVSADGSTVGEVLRSLISEHPALVSR